MGPYSAPRTSMALLVAKTALEITKEVSGIPERLSEREIRLYRVEPKPRSR